MCFPNQVAVCTEREVHRPKLLLRRHSCRTMPMFVRIRRKLGAMGRLLYSSFKMPKDLRMLQFHIFRSEEENPGQIFVKELTSTTEWKAHDLQKQGVDAYRVGIDRQRKSKFAKFKSEWPDLEQVDYARESNRKSYLHKHVCQQYFHSDPSFRSVTIRVVSAE